MNEHQPHCQLSPFQDPSFKTIYGATGSVKEPQLAINHAHISNLSFRCRHHFLGPSGIQIKPSVI